MTVSELIEILKKCDPSAETLFCYGENKVGFVGFVEFDTDSNNVFFYEDEPTWDTDSSLDYQLELHTITLINDGFAETTYREPLSAEGKEIRQAVFGLVEALGTMPIL